MDNNRKTWDNRTKPQERKMYTLILYVVYISKARRGTGEQITTIGKPMKAERTSKETTRKTIGKNKERSRKAKDDYGNHGKTISVSKQKPKEKKHDREQEKTSGKYMNSTGKQQTRNT